MDKLASEASVHVKCDRCRTITETTYGYIFSSSVVKCAGCGRLIDVSQLSYELRLTNLN